MLERYTGSLLGLAVGDALGAPVEHLKAGRIQQLVGEVDSYVNPVDLFPDRPGKWRLPGLHTDDTQQALAVADILAIQGVPDLDALRDTWLRLCDEGPSGAPLGAHRGCTPGFRRALDTMRNAEDPRHPAQPSADNGAVTRAVPLGLWFVGNTDALTAAVADVSLLTHGDPRAIAAAYAVALTVSLCIGAETTGQSPTPSEIAETLAPETRRFEEYLAESRTEWLDESALLNHRHTFSQCLEILPALVREARDDLSEKTLLKQANEAGADSRIANPQDCFVAMSVPLAIYRALVASDYLSSVLQSVNAGGDTDTVAAIVGAIAGARFSESAIPVAWRQNLVAQEQVRLRGRALYEKEVDWSAWNDLVALETELTQCELDHIERASRANAKAVEKRHANQVRKQQRKAEKAPPPDPGFAPPPEVWLRDRPGAAPLPDMEPDMDPIESAKARARRGRKRIAWKEERRQKRRDRDSE